MGAHPWAEEHQHGCKAREKEVMSGEKVYFLESNNQNNLKPLLTNTSNVL